MKIVAKLAGLIVVYLEKIFVNGAGFVILLMALMVTYASLQRYIFSQVFPSIFYDEYTGYLLVISSWLALGSSFKQGRFARVEMFVDLFPAMIRAVFKIAANIGGVVLLCILTWQSGKQALYSWQIGAISFAAEVPLFLVQMFVPIGTFAGVIIIVHMTLGQIGVLISERQSKNNRNAGS